MGGGCNDEGKCLLSLEAESWGGSLVHRVLLKPHLELQRGLQARDGGGERSLMRKSRKRRVKGQILKFFFSSGENSRLSSGEIQSPLMSHHGFDLISPSPSLPRPPTNRDSQVIA